MLLKRLEGEHEMINLQFPQRHSKQSKKYFLHFIKVGTLYHNVLWLSCSGVSCGWRRACQRRAYAKSALPGLMAGRPWAMAELMRRALCWHWTLRRHLQETDEPNQAILLFLNRRSAKNVIEFSNGPILLNSLFTFQWMTRAGDWQNPRVWRRQFLHKFLVSSNLSKVYKANCI